MLSRVGSSLRRPMSSKAVGVNLAGIFPPIPTPFNADETIAYDKLSANFKTWDKIPFAGYVVQGSNGEYPLLSPCERVEMVARVKQLIPKDKLLIAGSSGEGTRITIEITNEMAAAGADAVLVTTPGYFKSSMLVRNGTKCQKALLGPDVRKTWEVRWSASERLRPSSRTANQRAAWRSTTAAHTNVPGLRVQL